MIFLLLFYEFFKIGLFAIGGGLATLPFLYELAEKYDWFTTAELVDMIAVSEATPGAMGLNMATYVGYRTAGIGGALAASFSLILPGFIIAAVVAAFLKSFKENRLVQNAFCGLRPAVTGLIAAAGFQVLNVTLFSAELFAAGGSFLEALNLRAIALFIVILAAMNKLKLHPVFFLAASAVISITIKL